MGSCKIYAGGVAMKRLVVSSLWFVVTNKLMNSGSQPTTNYHNQPLTANCKLLANRRAIMFTALAALFAVVMFSLVAIRLEQSREQGEAMVYKVRCEELNAFLEDMSSDLSRALEISAKRAATHAVDFVATNGTTISNATQTLVELTINGTLNGANITGMTNHTIQNWFGKIDALAKERHFSTSLNANMLELNFVTYTAWEFRARSKLKNLQINDSYGYCSFNGTLPRKGNWISSNISVLGLEDPLYMLKTRGYVSRLMQADTNYTMQQHSNYNAIIFDITSKTYHPSDDGPSFFEKLEGKLGSPVDNERHDYYVNLAYNSLLEEGINISISNITIGMETFVDVSELQSKIPASIQPLIIQVNQSVVDHVFFGPSLQGKKLSNVTPTYTWFSIDTNHSSSYNINSSQLYE